MVDDRIRDKLANLVRLAERPGTPQEGEVARATAIRLSLKYGIPCEFTTSGSTHTSARPTASAPQQDSTPSSKPDGIFYHWIKALQSYGWNVSEHINTKIGLQLRFRKLGYNSEVRVTQRKGSGNDFEAEHIMKPDPINGHDLSYCTYITINLNELLRHIAHTK